jgi:hypothetical protein
MCWLFEAFGHHLIGQAEMVAGRLARCGILALAVGRHRLRLTTHKDVSPATIPVIRDALAASAGS